MTYISLMETKEDKMKQNIHSGNLSYLNRVHRQYGIFNYNMFLLKQWSDGKMTVEFRKKDETETERTD